MRVISGTDLKMEFPFYRHTFYLSNLHSDCIFQIYVVTMHHFCVDKLPFNTKIKASKKKCHCGPRAPSSNRSKAEERVFWFDCMEIIWEFYWKSLSMDRVVNGLRGSRIASTGDAFEKSDCKRKQKYERQPRKEVTEHKILVQKEHLQLELSQCVSKQLGKKPIRKQSTKQREGYFPAAAPPKRTGGH